MQLNELSLLVRVLVQTQDGRHSSEINLFVAREARFITRVSVPGARPRSYAVAGGGCEGANGRRSLGVDVRF